MNVYLKSALITFAAGFAIAVLPNLDHLTVASLQDGTLFGLVFAGLRTGLKYVLEAFIAWYSSRNK